MGWVESAREVVERKSCMAVDPVSGDRVQMPDLPREDEELPRGKGVILDLFSASVMLQVHDALKEENRIRFAELDVVKAQKIAFSVVK